MRSEYSEEDLRKVLGIKSGGSGGVGDKKDGAGDLSSSESSLENSPEPLLLFPCPGAEYLEVPRDPANTKLETPIWVVFRYDKPFI